MTNIVKTISEAIRRRRNLNATVDALHSLNDQELRDIGIHRGEIERVARGVVDIHRTVRDINEEAGE